MFRRVIIDEWVTSAPLISFAIIGLVFIVVTIRALRMSKETRDHLSSLPLQDHTKTDSQEKL
ncbi:MAG: hypothetical protein ABI600_19110 [Luteolibacter sp.]